MWRQGSKRHWGIREGSTLYGATLYMTRTTCTSGLTCRTSQMSSRPSETRQATLSSFSLSVRGLSKAATWQACTLAA